ncbi:uncharacterized protein CDAR_210761 [Caerostris darwini]|uniref:Uncharacterized protein n=1 Tax=Caerostris darwini TaxID=1538125 RepID=A0AAV4SEI4_9ARAC|nr:uncharacterized protein CDAR_210761 [Caerostris darwini]
MECIEGDNTLPKVPDVISSEDLKYYSLYFDAIKKLLNFDIALNMMYLKHYFKIVFDCFKFSNGGIIRNLDDVDLDLDLNLVKDNLYFRITCILKNGPIISSAVGFQLRNSLNKSPKYLQTMLKKKLLKICCLGGGSASDVVAIVTVLESMAKQKGIQLDFRITVVDSDKNWKNTCITVLSCLEQFHGATWKINFIQADVPEIKSYPPQLHEAIQEADIVTMVMLLSKCKGSLNKKTVKTICGILKQQSMLFILDTSWVNNLPRCFGCSGEIVDFVLIYEELCDYNALDVTAIKEVLAKYDKYFGSVRSEMYLYAFVRVWVKDLVLFDNKDKLLFQQSRFHKNLEKYNPLQGFLSTESFTKWENNEIKEKTNEGWNTKSVKQFIRNGKDFRQGLSNELFNQQKNVDRALENFYVKTNSWKKKKVAIWKKLMKNGKII